MLLYHSACILRSEFPVYVKNENAGGEWLPTFLSDVCTRGLVFCWGNSPTNLNAHNFDGESFPTFLSWEHAHAENAFCRLDVHR